MTLCIPNNFSTCLVNWSLVAIICKTMPPRDPNDDDDEDEEEEEDEGETTSRRSCANQMRTSDEAATLEAAIGGQGGREVYHRLDD